MSKFVRRLVIIGHGAAGLAAALAAVEQARRVSASIEITLLEKAPRAEAGGNTRFSPSFSNFEEDVQHASGGRAEPSYFSTLAKNAAPTLAWLQSHGIKFLTPTYYLSAESPRIQPAGAGKILVERLSSAAGQADVKIRYDSAATRLVATGNRLSGVDARHGDGSLGTIGGDAVILATGGFQGNPEMLRRHIGSRAATMKLISPGSHFDTGDGIRLASEVGARLSGDWSGMHAEPVDPRSENAGSVVLVYPYGIGVDQNGFRFFDEGGRPRA